jgi:hypothetical protein
MQETAGTEPVIEQKPQVKHENKVVDISSLSLGQRELLKGGIKNAAAEDVRFNALGFRQKEIFWTTCDMFTRESGGFKAIIMLDIIGEEYWKAVTIPNQKKKEQQRFIKFKFDYVIPGTSNKLSVMKEWKYEDFTP